MTTRGFERRHVPRFDREFFRSPDPVTRIGDGELGGKAHGLVLIRDLLGSEFEASRFPGIEVYVPKMAVVATEVFDAFLARNGLHETALSDLADDRMAEAFLRAEFPTEMVGDLRALVEEVHTPLAIRSSSLLEDFPDTDEYRFRHARLNHSLGEARLCRGRPDLALASFEVAAADALAHRGRNELGLLGPLGGQLEGELGRGGLGGERGLERVALLLGDRALL